MNADGIPDIVDFSLSPEPKKFRINDDVFEMAPVMPLGTMIAISKLKFDQETLRAQGLEPMLSFFDELFIGTSSTRFRSRVIDKENPIGLEHVLKIIPWMLEVYGMRPTEASLPSSTPPTEDGETSTAGASPEASTHSSSPAHAS